MESIDKNFPESESTFKGFETSSIEDSKVINLVEEHVVIDKNIIETGRVKISKKVSLEHRSVDVPVYSETVEVVRVAVNDYVKDIPQIRYEGETMIIPVFKEVVVVEKKLLLVEELHIFKHRLETIEHHSVKLKKDDISITRIDTHDANLL